MNQFANSFFKFSLSNIILVFLIIVKIHQSQIYKVSSTDSLEFWKSFVTWFVNVWIGLWIIEIHKRQRSITDFALCCRKNNCQIIQTIIKILQNLSMYDSRCLCISMYNSHGYVYRRTTRVVYGYRHTTRFVYVYRRITRVVYVYRHIIRVVNVYNCFYSSHAH